MRVPFKIGSPFRAIVTDVLSNRAVQPASHSCPIDVKHVFFIAGKRCTMRAAGGNLVSLGSSAV